MTHHGTILIVDDVYENREVLAALLKPHHYLVHFAEDGQSALAKFAAVQPDLVLLDVMMPDLDGYEVCKRLRAHPELGQVPIMLITALDDRASRIAAFEAGADDFISKPYDRAELRARVRNTLRMNRYRLLLDERQRAEEQARQAALELAQAYDYTLEGWAQALDLRDQETEGHSRRVTELTVEMARAVGTHGEELVHIRRGALLHDIGKLGIPDAILLKPGPLNQIEMATMQQHTVYAFAWLSPIEFLRPAIDIPHYHHEKWNGTGYPNGLNGNAIPLAARMFALVDVWDALTNDRPYRRAWTHERAREYIASQRGIHFDPQLTDLFLDLLRVHQPPQNISHTFVPNVFLPRS